MSDLVVWKATNGSGETCAFGVESLARVWAGKAGAVEVMKFRPHAEQPAAPAVELTKLEAFMLRNHTHRRSCAVEDMPDAQTVWLRVGVQSFCVTPHCCETTEEAEWTRAMLAKALANLVLLTPNAKSQATDAALSRQVACTDGLGVAVSPAPTFGKGE
ncbi:hypothetical protein [Propionivibrio sp.]|uniref:hypothetical protein n=1 Tax=Propionivibrio sp. TaxID=2212460 RepID=UPI0025FEFF5E|nr:hypothetical protein [Propionivibrio sp.]MBK8746122.1 hypothetical protein [Propionivibrio sp.]